MNQQTAFEYVAGTLSAAERAAFEQALTQDTELQQHVQFWEEHFMALQENSTELPPKPNTWAQIEARLHPAPRAPLPRTPWYWLFSLATALVVAIGLGLAPMLRSPAPNLDYVAVLTDLQGAALLTALTTDTDKTLWLQWEAVDLSPDTSLQLWARSKRDGQVRSLGVFDSTAESRVELDQARLRLIHDAQELLLTREESGGSPLGEPSEMLLAKGVCVRLRQGNAG
jgi:anti-sigma-K factor RskA